jgi:hypothetical protein
MTTYTDNWISNDFILSDEITIGDVIKLKNPLGEAFWIIVRYILLDDIYIGEVNNHLVNDSEYNYGDLITFTKKDIREHKNRTVQKEQYEQYNEIINFIVNKLTMQLGRKPTLEEIDLLFTNFF